ncbi:MAG: hypothetical protein U0573_08105 [Phycisphaerales bacterium]|nr:hypothetical protein [Planctomycetota bacterium]
MHTRRMLVSALVSTVACLAIADDEFNMTAAATAEPDQAAQSTEQAPPSTGVNPKAKFGFSNKRFHDDPEIGWKGFLSGLRGFEQFYNPIGNPLYFETPLNNTDLRFVYIYHTFAQKCQLQGGNLNIAALQARLAVTERLGLIATKDGYSWLDAGAVPANNGWNSLAFGAKYAFYVDRETDTVATGGIRWMTESGEAKVLQGGVQELSPFISVAKGWDRLHFMGDFTWRAPLDTNKGNNIIQWDLHTDYDMFPDSFSGFAPMAELHGLTYVDDGSRTPLTVGGLDYNNLGSTNVAGSTVIWFGVGARYKFTPNASLGADFEYPLTNRNADIMGSRVTVDFILTW